MDSVEQVLLAHPVQVAPAARGRPSTTVVAQVPRMRDLPDYAAPFLAGSTLADAQGNLWVLPNTPGPRADGLTYDVVDRGGAIVTRVTVPAGFSVVGFGPGCVYLAAHQVGGTKLVRARLGQ